MFIPYNIPQGMVTPPLPQSFPPAPLLCMPTPSFNLQCLKTVQKSWRPKQTGLETCE